MHDTAKDADSEALDKLSHALGDGAQEAAEKAKALFPFIGFEADMADDGTSDSATPDDAAADDEAPFTSPEDTYADSADSAGRRPPPSGC